MAKVHHTRNPNKKVNKQVERALDAAIEGSDDLFDRAPVMMHSIDKEGTIVNVNRRWLETMGYTKEEVLGHKAFDFLTEESRTMAIRDTLPLFWRAGSDHGIGLQFVRKDGRVLDILLDAEVIPGTRGDPIGLATLRDRRDLSQWEQAHTTIWNLKQLTHLQRGLQSILSTQFNDIPDLQPSVSRQLPSHAIEMGFAEEAVETLVEIAQDISVNLRALRQTQEEGLNASLEQQRYLSLLAKSIDRSLGELADIAQTIEGAQSSKDSDPPRR